MDGLLVKIGIVTRNMEAWSSTQVREALAKRNIPYVCFTFPKLVARLAFKPHFTVREVTQQEEVKLQEDLDALIIRPIGRGSREDIVIKPVFGSRGMGATRVVDADIADTIFKAITFHHGVIYLQEFVPHGHSDIRAFVVDGHVIAAMRRVAEDWKTNYSRGAKPAPTKLD